MTLGKSLPPHQPGFFDLECDVVAQVHGDSGGKVFCVRYSSYRAGSLCKWHFLSLVSFVPQNPCAHVLSGFRWVQLFATLRTVAGQAPLSMGFPREEYWSEWSLPPPGDLPDPNIEPASPMSPALAGRFFTTSATWEACCHSDVRPKVLPSAPPPLTGLWKGPGGQ